MANKKLIVSQDKITAVADAIRTKTNTTDTMTLDEMPGKISSISGGGSLVTNPLPKPLSYIDYNTNTLYIWPHPLCALFGADEWVDLTINGTKIPWTDFDKFRPVNNMDNTPSHKTSIAGDTINFGNAGYDTSTYPTDYHMGVTLGDGDYKWIYNKGQGTTDMNRSLLTQSEYVIPKVKGSNSIKIKYKARNITKDNPKKITVHLPISPYENNMQANTIGNGLPENSNYKGIGFESKFSANLFTDSPEVAYNYKLNECNISLTDINYDGLTTDILYEALNKSGILYAYDKSIAYTFDTSKAGNGITSTSSTFKIANIDGDNIIPNFTGSNWNNTNYVKISFTLTEAKNISINYIFNKTSTNYQYDGIWFGAIDKTMSITNGSYTSKSSITNCIYYAGDGSEADEKISTNDTSVHTYTYENVSAGEHYIQLRLFAYGYDDSYRPKITVTPVYEKADTGYYLPSTITVTDADTGETLTDYTYDPYTGNFTIPMTHSWNMTAVASTLKNILDKVSYNMNYNTGIMTLSSTGATSYTYNIDNGEEATTTGDIDLTSLSDKAVHTITSMASADGSRPSVKNSYKVYKNMSDTMAINDIGFDGELESNNEYYIFTFAYNGEIYKVYSKYVDSGSFYYYYFYRWPDTSAPVFTVSSKPNTPLYFATIDIFTGEISNITTSTYFKFYDLVYAMQVGNYIVFSSKDGSSYNTAGYGYFYILDMTTHKWVARYKTKYKIFLLSVDDEYLTLMADKNGSNTYYTITDKLSILTDSNHNVSLKITPMNISSTTFKVGFIYILTSESVFKEGIRTSDMTAITYNKDTNDYTILAMTHAPNESREYHDMLYLKNVQLSDFNSDTTTVYPTFRINEDVFALTKKHILTRDTNNKKIKIYEYTENSTGDGINMTKVGETTYTGNGMVNVNENAVYYTSEYPSSFSRHIFRSYIGFFGKIPVFLFY